MVWLVTSGQYWISVSKENKTMVSILYIIQSFCCSHYIWVSNKFYHNTAEVQVLYNRVAQYLFTFTISFTIYLSLNRYQSASHFMDKGKIKSEPSQTDHQTYFNGHQKLRNIHRILYKNTLNRSMKGYSLHQPYEVTLGKFGLDCCPSGCSTQIAILNLFTVITITIAQ